MELTYKILLLLPPPHGAKLASKLKLKNEKLHDFSGPLFTCGKICQHSARPHNWHGYLKRKREKNHEMKRFVLPRSETGLPLFPRINFPRLFSQYLEKFVEVLRLGYYEYRMTEKLSKMPVWDIFICSNGFEGFWNTPKTQTFSHSWFLRSKLIDITHKFRVFQYPMDKDWKFSPFRGVRFQVNLKTLSQAARVGPTSYRVQFREFNLNLSISVI